MLQVEDIHTYYGDSHILQGVSLNVNSGELVCLVGRNGAGKTTTIRSIIGFNKPRAGHIVFENKDVTGLPPYRIAGLGIGLVPQGRRIFPDLSVQENLLFAHPDVVNAVVAPVPHAVKGFVPAAMVIARAGSAITAEDLKAFCLDKGPAYSHPRFVEMVGALPLNGAGKIDRAVVQAKLVAKTRIASSE